MPYAHVNGQRLYYEDTGGEGPPIVFSHGFLLDADMFLPQVEEFGDRWRVVTWDQRALGRTPFDGQAFTFWDSAEDLIGLLDQLGIERAVLAGACQGGQVALRATLLSPDRVRALALIGTQAPPETDEVAVGYRRMLDAWAEAGYLEEIAEIVAGMVVGDPQLSATWKARWREWDPQNASAVAGALLDRDDITYRLEEIDTPALVVHGTEDAAVPIERGYELCAVLPDCRGVVEVEDATHVASLSHPGPVNAAIRRFLEDLPA